MVCVLHMPGWSQGAGRLYPWQPTATASATTPTTATAPVAELRSVPRPAAAGGGSAASDLGAGLAVDLDSYGFCDSENLMCFENIEDLLCIYDSYKPLWDCTSRHFVSGVEAQFKPAGWRQMLSGGPMDIYNGGWDVNSLFLLDGVVHGFKIIDP